MTQIVSFVHSGFNNLITGSHDLDAIGEKKAQFSINMLLLTFTNICPIFFTLRSTYNSVPGNGTLPGPLPSHTAPLYNLPRTQNQQPGSCFPLRVTPTLGCSYHNSITCTCPSVCMCLSEGHREDGEHTR